MFHCLVVGSDMKVRLMIISHYFFKRVNALLMFCKAYFVYLEDFCNVVNYRTMYFVLLILDENGPYYWHIKSGTIQREAPVASPVDVQSGNDAPSSSSVRVVKFLS